MRAIARMVFFSVGLAILAAALLSGHARAALIVTHVACLALIWITGIRALALWLRSRERERTAEPVGPLRVALLSCTADDLDIAALAASAAQDVPVDVYVLDDSRTEAARTAVDAAAAHIGARVLRRSGSEGAKAGNINHALRLIGEHTDAVVILDSDTVLPAHFVRRATAALVSDPSIACVQGAPVASGPSWFARFFGPLVRTHARVNHAPRARIGFPAFVGRGALLSVRALRDVGGFPHTVSEDLALSVRLRDRGWRIVHRPDIEFTEDFPIDYAAFRVQQGKAAEGAAEFLLSARGTRLPGRERRDIIMETALLPLGAAAGLSALALGTTLALLGTATPPLITAITAMLALAPLLPEALRRVRRRHPVSALLFLVLTPLLYASVSLAIVRHAASVARGRPARFTITPKAPARTEWSAAIDALRPEYTWALTALVVAALLGMPLLGLPFTVPALAATAFLLLGARPHVPLVSPAPRLRVARPEGK